MILFNYWLNNSYFISSYFKPSQHGVRHFSPFMINAYSNTFFTKIYLIVLAKQYIKYFILVYRLMFINNL